MAKLTSPKAVAEIMKRHGIGFTKSLGQNFLIDENILNKTVSSAEIAPADFVLEIGPGLGTLTAALARRARRVVAVEIDRGMIPVLRETAAGLDNVEIVEGDVLKADIGRIAAENFSCSPFKVVANLPYYITTQVVMKLLSARLPITVMVFMVQKEVARRMTASPGSKEYGALSVAVQFYSDASIEFRVPPSAFMPRPKVESAVVKLKVAAQPRARVDDTALFFKVVRLAFQHRRKTLANALSMGFGRDREEISLVLAGLGIHPGRRGETLSILEFASVSNSLRVAILENENYT